MENLKEKEITLISCESGKSLTDKIVESLSKREMNLMNCHVVDSSETWFANKEVKTTLNESIRRKEVFIIQLLQDPLSHRSVNDNLMALLTAIDATHHADASEINLILPQFPYGRQERRKGREGITAKLCANILEKTGVNRIFSFDLHAEAVVGFFDKTRLDNLRASELIIKVIEEEFKNKDFMVVAPDAGAAEMNNYYAKYFGVDLAMLYKTRNYNVANTIDNMKLLGDVRDKHVLLVDDMIDTGGTILKACENLKEEGAKSITLACTFPYFMGECVNRLSKAYDNKVIDKVIGTDAVPRDKEFFKNNPWYQEVSIANLCAHVIYQIYQKKSINEQY